MCTPVPLPHLPTSPFTHPPACLPACLQRVVSPAQEAYAAHYRQSKAAAEGTIEGGCSLRTCGLFPTRWLLSPAWRISGWGSRGEQASEPGLQQGTLVGSPAEAFAPCVRHFLEEHAAHACAAPRRLSTIPCPPSQQRALSFPPLPSPPLPSLPGLEQRAEFALGATLGAAQEAPSAAAETAQGGLAGMQRATEAAQEAAIRQVEAARSAAEVGAAGFLLPAGGCSRSPERDRLCLALAALVLLPWATFEVVMGGCRLASSAQLPLF